MMFWLDVKTYRAKIWLIDVLYLCDETWNRCMIDCCNEMILHILVHVLVNILINVLTLVQVLVFLKICTCTWTQEVQIHNKNYLNSGIFPRKVELGLKLDGGGGLRVRFFTKSFFVVHLEFLATFYMKFILKTK